MADLTITAANVVLVSGPKTTGTAGESLTAGQSVYLKSSDSKIYKADNNVTSAEASCVGIALHAAAANQPITYAIDTAVVNMGATLTVGETYIVSSTAGGVAPVADVSTNFVTHLGVALTAANLSLKLVPWGVQHA